MPPINSQPSLPENVINLTAQPQRGAIWSLSDLHTETCSGEHTHTHVHVYIPTRIYTPQHTKRSCTNSPVDTHLDVHRSPDVDTDTHRVTLNYAHTPCHSLTLMVTTHTETHTHTLKHNHIHIHTHCLTHTHRVRHTFTLSLTDTVTHSHTHTQSGRHFCYALPAPHTPVGLPWDKISLLWGSMIPEQGHCSGKVKHADLTSAILGSNRPLPVHPPPAPSSQSRIQGGHIHPPVEAGQTPAHSVTLGRCLDLSRAFPHL